MIVAIAIALGLALRLLTGRTIGSLAQARLFGESLLLPLLVVQAVLPSLKLGGAAAHIAFFVWLATFPVLVWIAWMNRKQPGMAVLGSGLALNMMVVAANGGMPVFLEAARVASASVTAIVVPAGDFVHLVGGAATRLPWLADVLPLPGPAFLRLVASPGDVLLYAGIVVFLAAGGGATNVSASA